MYKLIQIPRQFIFKTIFNSYVFASTPEDMKDQMYFVQRVGPKNKIYELERIKSKTYVPVKHQYSLEEILNLESHHVKIIYLDTITNLSNIRHPQKFHFIVRLPI